MYVGISESDLLKFPSTRNILESEDSGDIEIMFYALGMDRDFPIESMECYHRNLNNEVVYGKRYVGCERSDYFWLTSGYCSEEMRRQVATGNDLGFKEDLRMMENQPCVTQMFIDFLYALYGEPEMEEVYEGYEA